MMCQIWVWAEVVKVHFSSESKTLVVCSADDASEARLSSSPLSSLRECAQQPKASIQVGLGGRVDHCTTVGQTIHAVINCEERSCMDATEFIVFLS